MGKLVNAIVNGEIYQFVPLGEHVVRAADVCGGRPTFSYTRIEVAVVLDRLVAGESLDEIVAGYQGRVSRAAIMEARQVVTHGYLHGLPTLEPA